MMCEVEVYNMPEDMSEDKYIVATLVDGDLWFYGAYKSPDRAEEARREYADHRVILRRTNIPYVVAQEMNRFGMIVVMGRMPEGCEQCWIRSWSREVGYFCPSHGPVGEYEKTRPVWCPLRPAPEKREFPYSVEALERICDELDFNREAACGYVVGWNACIDAMFEEEKE